MAYNDEAVRAKLSTLNETQESIVTVAQWIMFHRRHADRTATLWLEKLRDSSAGKRLNLIYLANEVVQQSKARKREDFLIAFSPLIPEAASIAYRGAHAEIRSKIKRVIEVWRQRQIFDEAIQSAAESRIAEVEKAQTSGGKKLLGGSLFGGAKGDGGPAAPKELKALVTLQEAVGKASVGTDASLSKANEDYEKATDTKATAPPPPVQAARYSALLKSLASAESAVAESVKARKGLLEELEKLLKMNRDALEAEEKHYAELSDRKTLIEAKKRDVEDAIMRGLASVEEGAGTSRTNGNGTDPRAKGPDVPHSDDLVPPEVEGFTPQGTPEPEFKPAEVQQVATSQIDGTSRDESGTGWDVPEVGDEGTGWDAPEPGADLMASLSRPFSSTDMANEDDAMAKRQRTVPGMNGLSGTNDPAMFNELPGLIGDLDDLIRTEGGAH